MVDRHMITWRSRPWEGVSLLGFGMDAKTSKQAPRTLDELIAAVAIHYVKSGGAVCAFARMANCEIPCLDTAGRGRTNSVQASRAKKRELMLARPAEYRAKLIDGARAFARWCAPRGLAPHIRANGPHDDPLGSRAMARAVPECTWYDYTKYFNVAAQYAQGRFANTPNFNLTLSYSGAYSPNYGYQYRDSVIRTARENPGLNIAVVFRDESTLAHYAARPFLGREIIRGDSHDFRTRYFDGDGKCVALIAKGKAKRDQSGFVVDVDSAESTLAALH